MRIILIFFSFIGSDNVTVIRVEEMHLIYAEALLRAGNAAGALTYYEQSNSHHIAGAHGGLADSFRNKTNYQFMIGGQWVEHPGKIKKFKVNFLEDELTEGLEDFEIETEQYYMHYDPNIEIIATTKFDGKPFSPNNSDLILNPTWIENVVMPVAWKKRYGKGKVFYISIGHNPEEFKIHHDAWTLLTRGFKWAMK